MIGGETGDAVDRDEVEAIFAALSLPARPAGPATTARVSRRVLFESLTGAGPDRWDEIGPALARDPALNADFAYLCRRLAAAHLPQAAAASTGGLAGERPVQDGTVRWTPLPAFGGQVMVTILPRRRSPALRRLLLARPGEPWLRRSLPQAAGNGRIQFVIDGAKAEDARLLRLLDDPMTDGYFFD